MIPTEQIQRVRNATRVVDEVTTELIQDKLDKYTKGELGNNKDLLSILIKANYEETVDKSERMSFDELKNQVKINICLLNLFNLLFKLIDVAH